MFDDFKQILARAQGDYGFYIDCQTNPAVALAGYDLSADERSTLSDPVKLGDLLMRGIGVLKARPLPPVTVKVKGTHDWVNKAMASPEIQHAKVAAEVEAIKHAHTDGERTGATVRLMELIG